MLLDPRIKKLAHVLCNYSCDVQKGENVMVQATGADYQLVACIVEEIYRLGGNPIVRLSDNRITRSLLMGITSKTAETIAELDLATTKKMHCFIGIRGGENSLELSDVPTENMNLYYKAMDKVTKHRVEKTKWVVLRYPTQGMALQANMSTSAFEDLYFDVCTLDYQKMRDAMTPLVELMNKTDKVRIVAKDTDLTFSIKGIPTIKCAGDRNIPDGEIYTAPVKNSVEGYITYNCPSINNGLKFEGVKFEFSKGKIISATSSNYTDKLNEFLNVDEGARYIGEFALGVNPYIKNPMGDILFDEKISGSIHFTPGNCYEEASNGNKSAEHWDLVQLHTPEYGGGEIYFDDVLIRKNGIFTLPELQCLNPDGLK